MGECERVAFGRPFRRFHRPVRKRTASPLGRACRSGDIGRWPIAHSTIRPDRGVAPRPPVCPSREHVAPRPLRRIALRSVLARGQKHPAAPSVSRVRSRRLPARVGQTCRQSHTHEFGSMSSGWPPNPPASRSAKLFGEGGAGGKGGPVRERAHVSGGLRGKLLRPASRRLRRP